MDRTKTYRVYNHCKYAIGVVRPNGHSLSIDPVTSDNPEGGFQLLTGDEICMVRVESGETRIYTEKEEYSTRKRLYEVLDQLGGGFMQISKACVVNLSFAESVEAGFGGSLLLKMKNGLSEYVSRTYLPGLKNYLGI